MRIFRVAVLLLVGIVAVLAIATSQRPAPVQVAESIAVPIAAPPPPTLTPRPAPTPTATGQPVAIPTAPPRHAGDHDIEILDDLYSPVELSVPVGKAIVWRNFGERAHDILSLNNSWHTLVVNPGATVRMEFNRPGTFEYMCSYHAGMFGRIFVK